MHELTATVAGICDQFNL